MTAKVCVSSVHLSGEYSFSKRAAESVRLVAGIGVEGDAHSGAQVRHRSRVAKDPTQPNLRQVHLIQSELFDELALQGYMVGGGDLGENITTSGIDFLSLPTGAMLSIGGEALIVITGLRNPCQQINKFKTGLLSAVLDRDDDRGLIRKAGVMAVSVRGGVVRPGDEIEVALPPEPHHPLECV